MKYSVQLEVLVYYMKNKIMLSAPDFRIQSDFIKLPKTTVGLMLEYNKLWLPDFVQERNPALLPSPHLEWNIELG